MTSSSLPDWVFPPPGGFVAEDLDHIPDLPAHTELIDGSLVFVSPQASFHMRVVSLLESEIRRVAPKDLRVRREMSVILDKHQRPEPDLFVIPTSAEDRPRQTFYRGQALILAVEVVSPESEVRDRKRKPALYAEAGIPHFWRVEDHSDKAVVYAYELDPATNSYALTGIHHERLKVTVPFDIDIDLTEIDRI
ncbi:Uma2 family endonuclease [Nonomuraea turkmeniaca]|uniref:Uma2 family endonuclease n=1 Tax=Nonomuraea turkmeniaca TaxID=103838 RepID=A0A5S4FVD9_9ACTN|nr:Uma2 family endonuclease [Nonomuraea turkmeniaca]TMR24593.1 Uma2 family endonuclease [Nonomuraea turkmeniaca]